MALWFKMALSMLTVLRSATVNKPFGWISRALPVGGSSCHLQVEERHFATQNVSSTVALPPAPKRPPSGFILFVSDARKNVLRQNPSLKPTEVVKTIAAKWKVADQVTKDKYATLARERFEAFAKEKEAYTSKLTAQQKQVLADISLQKKLRVSKKKLSEKLRELEKPKGVRSAYVLFSTAMRKQMHDKSPRVCGSFSRKSRVDQFNYCRNLQSAVTKWMHHIT